MARRKKTPDVLAEQTPQSPNLTRSEERKQQPSVDQPDYLETPAKEESSSDLYATLFSPPLGEPSSRLTRIKLAVTGEENLAREVQHCVSQALGRLPHAQFVQEGEDWTLIVLGAPIQPPGGKTYGVALSAVATRTVSRRQKSQPPQPNLQDDSVSSTPAVQSSVFKGSWLRIGALTQIQRLCEQLVSDFSSRYLTGQSATR